MIVKFFRNACLAAAVSIGAVGATAAPAAANGFSFGFTVGNEPVNVHYRGGKRGRGYERHGHRARGCNPRRAVRKAGRIGLRHARVVRVTRRGVAVAGRLHGDRTIVRFGNRRGCPVRRIRSH